MSETSNRTGRRVLIHSPGDDAGPAWTPDGAMLVFHSTRDGNLEIYVARADGSGQRRLTATPSGEGEADWFLSRALPPVHPLD